MGTLWEVSSSSIHHGRNPENLSLESLIMLRQLPACISTWIAPFLRNFLISFQRSERLECGQCGRVIDVQRVDGTSSLKVGIEFFQASKSLSKFYLEATGDGKLLISCACSPLVVMELTPSGEKDGISSIVTNSATERNALPCGCDPAAGWKCLQHQMEDDTEPKLKPNPNPHDY